MPSRPTPTGERRQADHVTIWVCSETGDAMKVSSVSDEEFDFDPEGDYPEGRCACGHGLFKIAVVPIIHLTEAEQRIEELTSAIRDLLDAAKEAGSYHGIEQDEEDAYDDAMGQGAHPQGRAEWLT